MTASISALHGIYRWIFAKWRVKRFIAFIAKIDPGATETVIDVGGMPATWIGKGISVKSVECVNIRLYPMPTHSEPFEIRMAIGDGCALEHADLAYDIAFSNSVIEHVGTWERQVAFAREIRRVGRKLWVQTPAKECPVEPHFLALFVHWLPVNVRKPVVRYFTLWGWITRPDQQKASDAVDEIRLLTKREFRELFPDCTILTERLLGIFPKSYIAVRSTATPTMDG